MSVQANDIGHIIQLSIAPVFVLTGVGTKLAVLMSRLARIIDRTRLLEERDRGEQDRVELESLFQRSHLINHAIAGSTACGLLICLLIMMLFASDLLELPMQRFIAGSFVLAMLALVVSFVFLLKEIVMAAGQMRERHSAHASPFRSHRRCARKRA